MKNFCNSDYSTLIKDLIKEANYLNVSNRSKIAKLRDFTEIIVRKMLNIGSDIQIMFGQVKQDSSNATIKTNISSIDINLQMHFINVVSAINKTTRTTHHTQETRAFTDLDVKNVEDLLLDLYSMLFIQYFIDIDVDLYTEPEILIRFSILPPIIRYKTWDYLYKNNKSNIQIVNKMCLSMIKTYNKEFALNWLNEHQDEIKSINYPSKEEILRYKITHMDKENPGFCKISLDFGSYNNIYDLLLSKINDPRSAKNESGKMYESFEEAKSHFNLFKTIPADSSKELVRLHDLMEFVYIGRNTK